MNVFEFGVGQRELLWAHGWGHSHKSLAPLAEGLGSSYRHVLFDFPGFGSSPAPPNSWGTIEYADFVADWLKKRSRGPRVWIGHSFGCRIGIRVASRYPELLDGLVLIAAAGIRTSQPIYKQIQRSVRQRMFAILNSLAPTEEVRERLRSRWGSTDYRNSGPLRTTFVKVVNENLSEDASHIHLPVRLIYGDTDTETPVTVGKRFASLMSHAELRVLPRYGHLDILTSGRFQLESQIKEFLQGVWK